MKCPDCRIQMVWNDEALECRVCGYTYDDNGGDILPDDERDYDNTDYFAQADYFEGVMKGE